MNDEISLRKLPADNKVTVLKHVDALAYTRWFKYDRDYLCVNKPQFVPVIFEPPCKNKYKWEN
jgi:hypothetical protein